MKIRRVILKGVNNFEDFDYSFEDKWSEVVPDTLLFMGANGSGKSTLLRIVATLWQSFGDFLDKPGRG